VTASWPPMLLRSACLLSCLMILEEGLFCDQIVVTTPSLSLCVLQMQIVVLYGAEKD